MYDFIGERGILGVEGVMQRETALSVEHKGSGSSWERQQQAVSNTTYIFVIYTQ